MFFFYLYTFNLKKNELKKENKFSNKDNKFFIT